MRSEVFFWGIFSRRHKFVLMKLKLQKFVSWILMLVKKVFFYEGWLYPKKLCNLSEYLVYLVVSTFFNSFYWEQRISLHKNNTEHIKEKKRVENSETCWVGGMICFISEKEWYEVRRLDISGIISSLISCVSFLTVKILLFWSFSY